MQISWWTLLLQGVNFLVLVWLLQHFLFRPVQDVIEKRKRVQREAAAEVEQARREAEAMKRRYATALAGIEVERKSEIDKAHAELEAERSRLIDDAKRTAAEQAAQAREDVERDRAAALAGLREEIADLAVKLARTTLSALTKEIPNDVVLDQLVAEIADLPPAERRRLEAEIADNGSALEVVTARRIDPTERQEWKARLEAAIGRPLTASFDEDPSLISGAIIRLPHTTIHASWADRLEQARNEILRGQSDGIS
jgi:F-type H+-transporting ATPase subunit b